MAAQDFHPHSGDNQLPAGEFNLKLDPGQTLQEMGITGIADQTILNCPPINGRGIYCRGDNLLVKNFEWRGSGFFADKSGGRNTNVVIDNIIFKVAGDAIKATSGFSRGKITNNLFRNSGWATYLYNGDQTVIANNETYGCGFNWSNFGAAAANFANLIEQNWGTGISGPLFQLQGAFQDLIVQDNEGVDFAQTGNNNDRYFISAPLETSVNPIIRRNRCLLPTLANTPYDQFVVITFELGGQNYDCYDNYSIGGNDIVAINGANARGKVRDNRFALYDHGFGCSNGAQVIASNNGATVALTWDINRRSPGRNFRYGSTPPIQPPPNMPSPTILSPAPGTSLKLGQIINAVCKDSTTIAFDLMGDGLGDFATGAGTSLSARIPANATTAQKVQIKATGPGGNAMQEYPLIADVTQPPPVDPCAGVKAQLAAEQQKTAQLTATNQSLTTKLNNIHAESAIP